MKLFVDKCTCEQSVDAHCEWFYEKIGTDRRFREAAEELRGETVEAVGVRQACHGDVIVEHLRQTYPNSTHDC